MSNKNWTFPEYFLTTNSDCHIVTTTTHKSLRGPRAAMIFYKKGDVKGPNGMYSSLTTHFIESYLLVLGEIYDLEKRVNFAVFPTLQGGPHEHQIAAIAVCLKEAMTPEFKQYAKDVKTNMQELVKALKGLVRCYIWSFEIDVWCLIFN